ncbi:hypothetical protein [Saccharopolyspora rhizosphaerae]|nr:hypothetical protein [Saccharopolyspora rhizosphaerae]
MANPGIVDPVSRLVDHTRAARAVGFADTRMLRRIRDREPVIAAGPS